MQQTTHTGDPLRLLETFATLSDPARVRLLRVLQQQELSVGELSRAVQLPQSTVSRHLKLLFDKQWVAKRTEGTASLYRLDEQSLSNPDREVWRLAWDQLGDTLEFQQDDDRLDQVLRDRKTDSMAFFGRIGGQWDALRAELFGQAFTHEALLALLPGDIAVADLGCGTGNAAELIALMARSVIAVDREPSMIDAARKRLSEFANIECRVGELTEIPIDDASIDVAMVFLVMHHVEHPDEVVADIRRILRPGGALLVVDMLAHDREVYRHTMGHVHLGFDLSDLQGWAENANMSCDRYFKLAPDTTSKGPGLFAATLRK